MLHHFKQKLRYKHSNLKLKKKHRKGPRTPRMIDGWNLRVFTQLKRKIIWTKPSWLQVQAVNLPGCIHHNFTPGVFENKTTPSTKKKHKKTLRESPQLGREGHVDWWWNRCQAKQSSRESPTLLHRWAISQYRHPVSQAFPKQWRVWIMHVAQHKVSFEFFFDIFLF